MIKVFDYSNYKTFTLERIQEMPKKGFGQFRRIAEHLKIHTTRLSQVFRGPVHLTFEQAVGLCRYLGMNQLETEYYLALIELEKAGTEELREHLRNRIASIRDRAKELVHRLPKDRTLTESERAVFYSSWQYAAVSLATMIEGYRNIDALSVRFNIPREKMRQIVEFLLSAGICKETEKGLLIPGTRLTHLESASPLVVRHHANWRMKAMQRHENLGPSEIAYSAPVSIATSDQKIIREMVAEFLERFSKTVQASAPEEKLACLNIDWFEI